MDIRHNKPSFGERVLVWDTRFRDWTIALYVREGDSNTQGHFEVWLHGHCVVLTGARHWHPLPKSPVVMEKTHGTHGYDG